RVDQKVRPIEPGALHSNDAEDIAPLPVGRFSAGTVPAKFLQEDVLRRVHGNRPARTDHDRQAPSQLLLVERRAARDEEIHLQLRGLMDQIRATVFAHGPPKRAFIDVEVRFERRHERWHVGLVEGDDKIDIDGRARFPGKGTGQGSSDRVRDAQGFENARDGERNGQGIDRSRHGGSNAAMSGYTFCARSAPSVTTASLKNTSRGDASGWRWRTPARASS